MTASASDRPATRGCIVNQFYSFRIVWMRYCSADRRCYRYEALFLCPFDDGVLYLVYSY